MFTWINSFLDGKKTLIAIISGIATFILLVTTRIGDGIITMEDLSAIGAGFTALMAIVGLGHKASKILDFIKK